MTAHASVPVEYEKAEPRSEEPGRILRDVHSGSDAGRPVLDGEIVAASISSI